MAEMTNPYLEEFLKNTLAVKREIEQNEGLMEKVRTILKQWPNDEIYRRLIPNMYGIKRRHDTNGKIEVTVTADLYRPNLHISPFCLVLENSFNITYLTKDFFGEVNYVFGLEAGHHEEEALCFPPITEATRYMDSRGYGKFSKDIRPSSGDYWMNLFLFNPKTKEWAMHDLECTSLSNFEQIADGVDNQGKLSRLHDIWRILSSDDYRLDLNGSG